MNFVGSDIKYHVQEVANPFHNKSNHLVLKNNEPIYQNNNHIENHYNEFSNKGYAVTISEFACSRLADNYQNQYGDDSNPSGTLRDAVYIVDLQIEIYKEQSNGHLELYNTVDFQKTIFVSNVFI